MLSRKPGTLQKLKLHFYHGICACFGAGGAEKNKGVRSFTPKIKNREKNTCSPKNTADQSLLVLKILRKEKKPWALLILLLPPAPLQFCLVGNDHWRVSCLECSSKVRASIMLAAGWNGCTQGFPQVLWGGNPPEKKKNLVEHTSVGNRPRNQNLQMST